MDTGIINPFVEAVIEVTQSMAQLEATIGKVRFKTDQVSQGEVTGFIELSSPSINGSLALSFDSPALLSVYQGMLGEELQQLDSSAFDLAGEITNMVCGGAKQRLSEQGLEFELTRPIILSGKSHSIKHRCDTVLTLPLALEKGEIFIEVSLSH